MSEETTKETYRSRIMPTPVFDSIIAATAEIDAAAVAAVADAEASVDSEEAK